MDPIPGTVPVQQTPEPDALSQGKGQARQRAIFGLTLSFHFVSLLLLSFSI